MACFGGCGASSGLAMPSGGLGWGDEQKWVVCSLVGLEHSGERYFLCWFSNLTRYLQL